MSKLALYAFHHINIETDYVKENLMEQPPDGSQMFKKI